jgi:tRNA(Ile)-lysidine synthase
MADQQAVPSIIGNAALLSAFAPLEAHPSAALAVSGGPDSMALMRLAARWLSLKGREPGQIAVLTVDHGLRPEAADEAAFVAKEAARLGFAHATLNWSGDKPKTGIQAAARTARYELMAAYCRKHRLACLATAHTEDDQAETLIMRLRRGSGLDGLASMARLSERGGVPLIRPLLGFSKARLTAYLTSLNVPFASDPSNANAAFERVRVRAAMKALAAAGIGRPALALTAARLSRSREALSATATGFLESHFSVTPLAQGRISLEAFSKLPDEIALRVLSQALALTGGRDEPPRMAKAERLLGELRGRAREAALGGCLIISAGGTLNFYREPGRMGRAGAACAPRNNAIWDGRFVLMLAADLDASFSVAPLGTAGWSICRKALKEQGKSAQVNRLAALTSPALWQGSRLVAAPGVDPSGQLFPRETASFRYRIAPRLSNFLTQT